MGMPKVDGKPYDRQQVQGETLDNITIAALAVAESRLGYDLTVIQGSYTGGAVPQSGGTHDGGGAVDLAAYDWDGKYGKVAVLRRIGFDAWHRPQNWDGNGGGEHIHAVLAGNNKLSPEAQSQVAQYKAHTNGLADHGPDTFPYHPDGREFTEDDYRDFRTSQNAAARRRDKRKAALMHALRSLVRLRKLTDDRRDKAAVQRTIATLRKH